jgi:hypothetical protein
MEASEFSMGQCDWEKCFDQALVWVNSSIKKLSTASLREGSVLCHAARDRQVELLAEAWGVGVNNAVPAAESTPHEQVEVTQTVELLAETWGVGVNNAVLTAESTPHEQVEVTQTPLGTPTLDFNVAHCETSGNSTIFSGARKDWKLPETFSQNKLLFTDNYFVGPMPSDFHHLTLTGANLADLNNLIRVSNTLQNISLVLIHLGYHGIDKKSYLKVISTAYNKIILWAENIKIFFTALVSKGVDSNINRFNTSAAEQLPENFLKVDLKHVPFSSEREKSELLLQEWTALLDGPLNSTQ